jgi:1-acyl-sn-glycerol-3-phosphate acyltransferase
MNRGQKLSFFGRRVAMPEVAPEAVRTVLSAWAWSMLGAVCLGGFGVQLPLALATYPFDRERRKAGRLARDLGVIFSSLNPMWDFRVHGPVPTYRPGRTVVVSNHVSNSDVFLISHLPWEMKYLGKSSLFKVPVIGWIMWVAGDVPVVRGTKDSIRKAMDVCRRHLEQGMPVAFFPEGTRSATGELLPFKDGAFRLAIEAGADVLPIAVAGTRDALPKHSWRFGFARGLVTVGNPISTAAMTMDDLERLKTEARTQIEAMVAELQRAGREAG